MKENSLCLKVIYPIEMRREVVLPKEGLIIGRSVEADFILEDEWISRKHCKVIQDKKSIKIIDLDSTNGTFIDGSQIQEAELTLDSNLQLGKIVLKLEFAQTTKSPVVNKQAIHPLTGLKTLSAAEKEIQTFLSESKSFSVMDVTLSFAEAAREDFGADASDFLMSEVGRILNREALSDEILIHGEEFQYFLLSKEATDSHCQKLAIELSSLCSKQVFQFDSSPLQGDVDVSWLCGNAGEISNYIHKEVIA